VALLFVTLGLVVIAGVALLLIRDAPILAPAEPSLAPLKWPPSGEIVAEHFLTVRFGVVVRGYRMEQVDLVLDSAHEEILARDCRIKDLEDLLKVVSGKPAGSVGPDLS
jgi:DivIVA domain-containing protein